MTSRRTQGRRPPIEGDAASMQSQPAGDTAAPVIDIENLSLTFETDDGPVHALSDIDLAIGEGDFVSLIGPSGCGKTTLLRVIADLEAPTGGTISVNHHVYRLHGKQHHCDPCGVLASSGDLRGLHGHNKRSNAETG